MRRACLGLRRMSTSAGEAWNADRYGVFSLASAQRAPKPRLEPKQVKSKAGKVIYESPKKIGAAEILKAKKYRTYFAQDLRQIMKLLGEKLYNEPDYVLARHINNQSLLRLSYSMKLGGDPQDNLVALVVDLAMKNLEDQDLAAVEAALRHSEVFEDAQKNYEEQGFDQYAHWLGYQIVSLAVSQNLLTQAIAMTKRLNEIYQPHPAIADLLFKAIAYHPLHKRAKLLKLFASIENLTKELDTQPSYVVEELMDWARFHSVLPTPANDLAEYMLTNHPQKVPHMTFLSLLSQNLDCGNPWGAAYFWHLYRPSDLTTIPPATLSAMLTKLSKAPQLHYICDEIIENLSFDYTASLGASVIEFCAFTKNLGLAKTFALKWIQVAITERPRHVLTALLHYAVVSRDSESTEELSQEIKRRDGRLSFYETQLLVTHMVQQSVDQGLEYVSKMDEHIGMHMYAAVAELFKDSQPEISLQCVREYQQFITREAGSLEQNVVDSFSETQVHLVLNSDRPNATSEALTLLQEWVAYDGVDLRTLSRENGPKPSKESRIRMAFDIIGKCEGEEKDLPVYEAAWEHLKEEGLGGSTIDFVLKH